MALNEVMLELDTVNYDGNFALLFGGFVLGDE